MYYYFYAPIPGAMCKIIALLLGLIICIFEEILHSPTFPKMKLFYSPSFTGECYRNLPVNETCFEKVVGDAGLLDFLELRLGLAGATPECSAIDRILSYKRALDRVKAGAFYIEAFENDDLATAKEILRWRDLLVMEGFNADTEYKSPRLQKLAEVEKQLAEFPEGVPERWKRVHEGVSGAFPGVLISVHYSLDLLPKLIRETLNKLGASEERIQNEMTFSPKSPDKISVYCFGTVAEAYCRAVDNHTNEAVICPDTFRLNAVLRNREKPLLESSACGDSSITQLFRLGLSLLERPLNINHLLEYLRIGFSPIPGEYRYAFADALLRKGGRGEDWNKLLAECSGNNEVQEFLLSLLNADVKNIGDEKAPQWMVSSDIVTNWCKALASWSRNVKTDERKTYQQELASLCDGMCRIMDNKASDRVDVKDLMKALKTLYDLSPVKTNKAMAQSWDAVDSHRSFIDSPKKLWWIPCNGGLNTPYPYSFLLKEERESLSIKEMPDFIQYDYRRMVDLLGKVDEIVLFTCDFDGAEALVEHPAVTICKQAAPDSEKDLPPKIKSSPTSSIFQKSGTLYTGVDLYPKDGDKDRGLSATSTETLIGFPFDFVMDKTLGYKDITSLRLSDITPTLGTVAHLVFQRMLEESDNKSIDEMKAMLKADFDERVEKAAMEKGEILLLPENKTLLNNFKRTLQKSIGVLLDILKDSNLKPVISEETLKGTLEGFADITGSVDFHAELPDGNIVVIDFKYSKGKSYIEKLEEDKAIQLEFYAEGLEEMWKKEGKKVVARAYYFFPINQLHTDDESGIFSEMVTGVVLHRKEKNDTPLSDRIRNSKKYRQAQLEKGTLEIEEGTPLEEIDYHKKVEVCHLIDIPKSDKKIDGSDVKANSPFANPTKYPILKNAIK